MSVLYATVHSSFYFSDDFLNFARARELGFTSDWINGDLFGHWLPARKALDSLVGAQWPVSWELGLAVLVCFVGIAAIFTGMAVRLLTGSASWGAASAAALPLSGSVVGTAQWFAGAAQVLPALAASAVLLWVCLLIGGARPRRSLLLGAVTAPVLFLGLLFDERAAVMAVLAPVFILLLPVRHRRARRMVHCYVFIAPTLALWYGLQVLMTPDTPATPPTSLSTLVEFMSIGILQNAVPALIGWTSASAVIGWVSWGVAGLVVVSICAMLSLGSGRRLPLAAAAVFLLAVAGVLAPVGLVRAGAFGSGGGIEPRYTAMAASVGVIFLAVLARAAIPVFTSRVIFRRLGAFVLCAIACGVAINLATVHLHPAGEEARDWAESLNASADEEGVVDFFNSPVPESVVPSGFYPYNLSAAVLPQLRSGVSTVVTSLRAGLVRRDGTVDLVAPTIVADATMQSSMGVTDRPQGCVVANIDGGRLIFLAPDVMPESAGVSVITVHGIFGANSGASVLSGPAPDLLRNKTEGVGGSPPVNGEELWVTTDEFADLRIIAIDLPPGESLCLRRVTVGFLPRTAP